MDGHAEYAPPLVSLHGVEPTEVHDLHQDGPGVTYTDEKKHSADIEVASVDHSGDELDPLKVVIPEEDDEVIDPRLKYYPIPQVARTVDLHNDDTEPILTFRFWLLSTISIIIGDGITTFYYFKPYNLYLSSYVIQLLSWGAGDAMSKYLPKTVYSTFGYKWSLNPGKWNAKEHALIVVAYWGSCYTAYGLGPLSAFELYYDVKMNAGWSIVFLITTQMIGYGFAGLYRDILVRPPSMYYPGVLPNVSLFNAMHKNPSVTKKSLRFFGIVAAAMFVYEFFPGLIFPMLSSLPLLCYFGHGHWITYLLGSGYYGFGLLDFTLDWNYASFNGPLYTPLWAFFQQAVGGFAVVYLIYPLMYFYNFLNAQNYAPMSSGTWDETGNSYNITRVMNADNTLNRTAMAEYSLPKWSPSYAMSFFWLGAASTGAMAYSILFYGPLAWNGIKYGIKGRREEIDDPYLKLMEHLPRVPHWWYAVLLAICSAFAIGQLYASDMQLPWWGFLVIAAVSAIAMRSVLQRISTDDIIVTFPNGVLWGIANNQIGMSYFSELIAGSLFPGKPFAVLACATYGRNILEQNLNLISDYKFGFYMKIPETEMFIGQVYGTFIGPFINFGVMRYLIDKEGQKLTQVIPNIQWDALNTRSFYSSSVIWGVLGPKSFFDKESQYSFVYYGLIVGPLAVALTYAVHRWKPLWQVETRFNPVLLFLGASVFPVWQSVNLLTSTLVNVFFNGYMFKYHPVWWRKWNYLLGVGMDCGTQLVQTVIVFGVDLPNAAMPNWWGNNADASDRCFPPSTLPPNALN